MELQESFASSEKNSGRSAGNVGIVRKLRTVMCIKPLLIIGFILHLMAWSDSGISSKMMIRGNVKNNGGGRSDIYSPPYRVSQTISRPPSCNNTGDIQTMVVRARSNGLNECSIPSCRQHTAGASANGQAYFRWSLSSTNQRVMRMVNGNHEPLYAIGSGYRLRAGYQAWPLLPVSVWGCSRPAGGYDRRATATLCYT